jgi:hypothetical protein
MAGLEDSDADQTRNEQRGRREEFATDEELETLSM